MKLRCCLGGGAYLVCISRLVYFMNGVGIQRFVLLDRRGLVAALRGVVRFSCFGCLVLGVFFFAVSCCEVLLVLLGASVLTALAAGFFHSAIAWCVCGA